MNVLAKKKEEVDRRESNRRRQRRRRSAPREFLYQFERDKLAFSSDGGYATPNLVSGGAVALNAAASGA